MDVDDVDDGFNLLGVFSNSLAIWIISHKLNMPINVPTAAKISPIIRFVRRWSSGRDAMMSLMLLTTLAILALADLIRLVLILANGSLDFR